MNVLDELGYERPEWMRHGACSGVDPNLFFPQRGESTAHAKALCARCAVRDVCLDYAINESIQHGIWGGKTMRERRSVKRLRGAA